MLFLLALYPEHQKLCQEEVDDLFQDESLCPGGDISYEGLSKLKYLERCINETLRLYPVAFAFSRNLEASLQIGKLRN